MELKFENVINIARDLIQTPSPAGYMQEVMPVLKRYLSFLNVDVKELHKGGLIFTIKGNNDKYQRMVSAHIDTLGAMVKEIKPNGRLKVIKVGGFAWRVVEGEYCSIITRNGKKISGTLLPVFPSAHISSEHEKIEANENTMEVRIDLDVNSKDDVLNSGIMIGDYVAFEPRFAVTDSGFVKSRYLDNKINVAIVLETLNSLKDVTLPYTTHIFFNTHEEIGYGGNSNISEKVKEYLAIDIAISAIGQTSTEKSVSICAMDSSGPFDYGFVNSLMELAKNSNIEHRLDIYPYYNSDATAALASGNDLIRALIGPGVDASHSLERTHKDAILETCKLLKAYLLSEGTR